MKVVGTIAGLILEELYFRKALDGLWTVEKVEGNKVIIKIEHTSNPYIEKQIYYLMSDLERELKYTNYELVDIDEQIHVNSKTYKWIVRKEKYE